LIAAFEDSTDEFKRATIAYLPLSCRYGRWAPRAHPEEALRPMNATLISAIAWMLLVISLLLSTRKSEEGESIAGESPRGISLLR
jgi:hypothetical protein